MSSRNRFTVLPPLFGAALLTVACTESLGPGPRTVSGPRFAVTAGAGIALDQMNGTLGENGTVLRKGFNPTNPHNGDAIIATFFWIGSPIGGNIITSVTDYLADGTPVGNTYTPVEFVTSGDIAMATYVATNVQNFPEGPCTDGVKTLVVQATLAQPVVDGGTVISAWTGVAGLAAQALGAHGSGSGLGTGTTVADPGAIPINAGALAYGVTMSNGLVGISGPAGFTNLSTMSDPWMKSDDEYDAEYAVQGAAGTVDPQWTWYFNTPSTWLASVLALNPTPATGDLTVTSMTTGSSLDPDGYTVTVDGTNSQPIPDNGSVTFSGLPAGDHTVLLSGVAANCTVSGPNPQTVTVPPGAAVTASFALSCTTTTGKMTGGGKLGDGRDFATFGFDAAAQRGELEWVQHCVDGATPSTPTCASGSFTFRGSITARSYNAASGSPTCRTWSGTGTAKRKDGSPQTYAFTVNSACDNGEPGRRTDSIDITIGAYRAAGYLTGGNIQLHNGG
jgi:hypothetical protein